MLPSIPTNGSHHQTLGSNTYLQVTPPRLDLPRYANADFLFDPQTDFAAVRRQLEETPADRIVISEEGLWGHPSVLLNPVFDGFRKIVIVYLRLGADLVASWAAENAEPYNAVVAFNTNSGQDSKSPRVTPLELVSIEDGIPKFTRETKCRFEHALEIMERIRAQGGDIVVRPFEQEQMTGGNAVIDFLTAIGVDPAAVLGGASQANGQHANPSRSRKFCDVSSLAWDTAKARGEERHYSRSLVEAIYADCRTGDDRPVIETLGDREIAMVAGELDFVEQTLSERYCSGAQVLKRKMPKVFGKDRAPYESVHRREAELLFDLHVNRRRMDVAATALTRWREARGDTRPMLTPEQSARAALEDQLAQSQRALMITSDDRDQLLAENDRLEAEKDRLEAERDRLLAERDHARRYPWKYIAEAIRMRRKPR